ncbi:NADP-dependent oxidoreductase domain-containing protein [Microdochium trichocladiopsis]|uniref:NADP-dependent oxidoreductase domain-containing protein n=1 Tax=Microdochium trichocladiopsis TaxID=1682393 RepID=A0A9P8Y9G6_9PEZI|nr:NADP-dependent oxidoreductase domain-containing protein [Microdochium trichocladiopsis]KAH7033156.1 NADP-dependent oxidoreductase domain-containing protein [Microdochium trichocladiopsis]
MGSVSTTPSDVPALVMGGAGFSYQLHPEPQSLPIVDILLRAFELGVCTIDTSPYYEPSEQLMGAALSQAPITSKYARQDYQLMTKVGRIAENEFNYSPEWIRTSVSRSLERFRTSYLDVVFCHDVEYVSTDEAVTAVGVLFDFQRQGTIHRVGISGYDMQVLADIAKLARERYGKPVDVIQTWAQLTLQNTQAESRGFDAFRAAGVNSVFCSSPLAVGLLRTGGIPVGLTGDWHPAPKGLRAAAAEAGRWAEEHGDGEAFSSFALQYAVGKARQNCSPSFTVSTITGISTISELEQNVSAAKKILRPAADSGEPTSLLQYCDIDESAWKKNEPIFDGIRATLGDWIDYDFTTKTGTK